MEDDALFLGFDLTAVEPEDGGPDPDRIIKGNPRSRTWLVEERDAEKLYAGVWESTPGAWRVAYDEWEFCTILSGVSIVHETGKETPRILRTGDSFILRPGFSGIWEVVETTRKMFVVRMP
ncbi:cupin [Pleomorphomonas diazotrophica]|uniref:Cupin n=1 Tax=Pleomorphomonas diazotrophica TaxID=1166257 RepID=A0A1I4SV77_9HYPH|nr:cupin domain-containing protein [Pleomorphomonas diazotrophica]PKR88555.1 cupin [Pleomorphomonas diazotrophica]SFM68315.1 hypothetical protein SAMN05192571_104168 [Pleomorphomonas diazotrophica]